MRTNALKIISTKWNRPKWILRNCIKIRKSFWFFLKLQWHFKWGLPVVRWREETAISQWTKNLQKSAIYEGQQLWLQRLESTFSKKCRSLQWNSKRNFRTLILVFTHKLLFFMPGYIEFLSFLLQDFSPMLKNSWNWDPIIRIISISNRRSKKRRWETFPFVMVIFFFHEKKIVLLNENKICGSGYLPIIHPSTFA